MVALRDRSVELFDYTGHILNLRYKSNGSVKAIYLAHKSRHLYIKVDKALRRSLAVELQPGMTVRVAGYYKYDKYGFPTLKADHLRVVSSPQSLEHSPAPVTTPITQLHDHRPTDPSARQSPEAVPPQPCKHSTPSADKPTDATILVCRKSSCKKRGSLALCAALESAINERNHPGNVNVKQVGCLKRCKAGPNLVFLPDKARYSDVDPQDVPSLLDQHL